MPAAIMNIAVEQGSTYQAQLDFVKEGTIFDISKYTLKGEVKASIYDEQGYPFRFELLSTGSVMMYLDSSVSSTFDFEEGVYDITMTSNLDGRVFRLIQGTIAISLGVTI